MKNVDLQDIPFVRQFRRNERGNIAVTFALALLPMLGFVGAAVDYTRASSAKTSLQSALDSAALMISKEAPGMSSAALQARGQAVFDALFKNKGFGIALTTTYTAQSGQTPANLVMAGTGDMATEFMGIMGFKTMPVGASSTVSWANTRMRIALALDVTGSMGQGGKMPAMKTAAAKLVKTLSSSAVVNEDVYISIVPFSKDVNVGKQFVGANWLDWADWNAAAVNQTCNNGGNHCTTNAKSTWNGCVTDRNEPYDTQNTAPTNLSTDFPAEQYDSCASALLPLTYDFDSVNAKIDSLQPLGSTNQPIGLAWAWKTLSSGQPFAAPPKDSNFSYLTAIILLTDGLNTQQRNSTYGDGIMQFNGKIDARQKILCDNIKTDGVTVYTIQVNTDGEATSTVLPYCASSSDKFFMLTSADQIMSAFDTIGASLQKLRVSK